MWSRDGSRIVFWNTRDGLANAQIYLMYYGGRNQTWLNNHSASDRYPTFTADGQHILFTRQASGTNSIIEMDLNGGNEHFINNGFYPSVPQNGVGIALTDFEQQTGATAIYLMNNDGTNRTRLTNN